VPLNQRWELNQSQMKFRWREQEKMMALPDLARNKPSSPVMICFPSSVFHFSFDLMLITYYICLHRFIFGLCLQVVWYKSNQEFGPLFFHLFISRPTPSGNSFLAAQCFSHPLCQFLSWHDTLICMVKFGFLYSVCLVFCKLQLSLHSDFLIDKYVANLYRRITVGS
jgi:hypothetical protein